MPRGRKSKAAPPVATEVATTTPVRPVDQLPILEVACQALGIPMVDVKKWVEYPDRVVVITHAGSPGKYTYQKK